MATITLTFTGDNLDAVGGTVVDRIAKDAQARIEGDDAIRRPVKVAVTRSSDRKRRRR